MGDMKVSITLRTSLDEAPMGEYLLTWGDSGWRFMRKNEVDQWYSVIGRPKPAPRFWAKLPKGGVSKYIATPERNEMERG